QRLVEAALRTPQRAGADVQAAAVEPGHGEAEAVALGTDAVLDRDLDVVEVDLRCGRRVPAELLLVRAEADAFLVLLDDQAGDALGPPPYTEIILAGADHGDVEVVDAAAGDELLRAV